MIWRFLLQRKFADDELAVAQLARGQGTPAYVRTQLSQPTPIRAISTTGSRPS